MAAPLPPAQYTDAEGCSRGIVNMGNTCFLSALVQGLSAAPLLRRKELKWKRPLSKALWWTLEQLWDHNPDPVHLDRIWEAILRRHATFRPQRQHDLFECWQVLADVEPLKDLCGFTRKLRTKCGSQEGIAAFWPMRSTAPPSGTWPRLTRAT